MKVTFELPPECLSAFLKECVVKENWCMIEFLFLGGGGKQSYREGAGGLATGCDACQVSLNHLIKSKRKINDLQKLLTVLIDHGAAVDGVSDLPPLSVAVNEKDYESALILLERKASVDGLIQSKISKPGETPAHTALRIGLSSGELTKLSI